MIEPIATDPQQPELDTQSSTVHNLQLMPKLTSTTIALVMGGAVLAGLITGGGVFALTRTQTASTGQNQPIAQVPTSSVKVGDVFGSSSDAFSDNVTGYLEIGGLRGEGSHRLLRPGGDSQTVYLTSSITDLDQFAGMEVKIWGETFAGQQAGWLMDVGRIEVLDTDAESPVIE